jgi:hypothetical protein
VNGFYPNPLQLTTKDEMKIKDLMTNLQLGVENWVSKQLCGI